MAKLLLGRTILCMTIACCTCRSTFAQSETEPSFREAVGKLIRVLGDPDEEVAARRAILTLSEIGSGAVLPLIEVLGSDNELLRRNVGIVLTQIADPRAASALVRMAKDESEAVRYVANQALKAMRVSAGADPVALALDQAKLYLNREGVGRETSDVVWRWVEGRLTCVDVPEPLYHLELAKRMAEDARRQDPANEEAMVLLARAYFGQAATIIDYSALAENDAGMRALLEDVPGLRRVAMAVGPTILRRVLRDSILAGQVPVAVMAIEALADTETREDLIVSPLLGAMGSRDTQISYSAALAVCEVASGTPPPNNAQLVEILARAVSEEAMWLIKVVAGQAVTVAAVHEVDRAYRGLAVDAVTTGKEAIRDVYSFPDYDVVIIDEDLPDLLPQDVIALIRQRNPSIKIILLSTDPDVEAKYGGMVDGFLKAPLQGEDLNAKVIALLGAAGAGSRVLAERFSIAASEALYGLVRSGVDVSAALGSLKAQLGRSDAVSIPAALAIGEAGDVSAVDPLLALLASDATSAGMQIACAKALGGIFAHGDRLPRGCYLALLAIANDDARDPELRSSIVTALGRGRLSPGERLKLTEALKLTAQSRDS